MMQPLDAQTMLTNGQLAPLSSRPSPRQHASQRSYLTGAPASYSPLHGPDTGLTLLTTSCGFTFIEGQEYLLYSRDGETVSLCSRTRSIDTAQDDLDALGEGIGPEPTPTGETSNVTGGCGLSSGSSLVSIDAALFGLLAGLLWYRRRKQV